MNNLENTLLKLKRGDIVTLIDDDLNINRKCRVIKISKAGKIELDGLLYKVGQTKLRGSRK